MTATSMTATTRRLAHLVVALAAPALAALAWAGFVGTFAGQRLDAAAYGGAFWARVGPWPIIDAARVLVLPGAAVGLAVAVVWLWSRGLRRRAAVAVVVALGSAVTIQLLKHVLPRPDLGFTPDPNSLPSGHTGAIAVALASLVLAAPPARRALVALGGAWVTAAVGSASVVAHQHRPSDIVAAVLVVVGWVAAGMLGDGRDPGQAARRPDAERIGERVLLALGAAFAVPAVLSLALAVLDPTRPVGGLETLVALVGGLAAITSASSFAFAGVVRLAPGEPSSAARTPRGRRLRTPSPAGRTAGRA
jgi:hypothetical protein